MFIRGLFALLLLIPFWFLSSYKPIWLIFLVALAAFGCGGVIEYALRRRGSDRAKRTAKIGLSIAVVAVCAALLVHSSVAKADYYKHVNELNAEPERFKDKRLKVHGFVEAGSIDEQIVGHDTVRTFVLEYQGERIRVRHKGPKPDTFKDQSEVVAQGRLVEQPDGELVVEATELMAKCPSKYEENRRKLPATGTATSAR